VLAIDRQILNINKVICRHINSADSFPRGVISQDILSQLRNFTEHIMLKFYGQGGDIDNSYTNICSAIKYTQTHGDLKVLYRFHDFLQIVASHYTMDEESSERLMLKYYAYLLKIKIMLRDKFSLDVLENLEKFPLHTDPALQEYYEKIVEKIKFSEIHEVNSSEKYYIQKIKPFFVKDQIYYEVTFTSANDYASKFDRVIAFTRLELTDNYAVRLALNSDSICILGKTMPITIITGWEVSIRDCEYKNFAYFIKGRAIATPRTEQESISQFLTSTGFCLSDLLDFPEKKFQSVKTALTQRTRVSVFFDILTKCRGITQTHAPGSNILRYLLFHMNNRVMKKQSQTEANQSLSGLYMKNGCIPFDTMPYCSSLINHNPKLRDLFDCISPTDRQHELLARLIRNNTELDGQLFTSVQDISGFDNIPALVDTYNKALWSGHQENSKLVIESRQIFINGYKKDTCIIIDRLKQLASTGVKNYSNSVQAWLAGANHGVDCDEKKTALTQMFESSQVALLYGSAGTGKSTLINHVAHFFAKFNKLFLAQTNPAVDNLKRRVTASNCTFSTIAKFLRSKSAATEYDLVVMDECSTVSNRDMCSVLAKAQYKLLLLVGDTYQIESIQFGNWFSAAQAFIPKTSVFKLTKPYRSSNSGLLTLWDRVRRMDEAILEGIIRQEYSATLDASIFSPAEMDEIILCLNYDGLYGINNINRFLQGNNPTPAVTWGIHQYKVNDPVLFNESDRFSPVIYNNIKGRIAGIQILDPGTVMERIQFDIELDKVINGMDVYGQDFELLGNSTNGNSVVRFSVYKTKSTDEDDNNTSNTVIPFQIAYAVSIHKAQGLEYQSVKIVITDEVDELITHSIFYTAITRAQEKLKIYWTPEVEHKVLSTIHPRDMGKDIGLLKKYIQ